ncbi:hypothetical protein NM208_g15174 [Fusarium decemcellulare]|uniref:Uncharacterized protein n=1 Tax=Fusarium decemcellulare TaxID=57161 RepID=A0ACC1RDS9_9HYPO|nr:hypothetical protein NM208_g15174 [Fusarium decemcellulare]
MMRHEPQIPIARQAIGRGQFQRSLVSFCSNLSEPPLVPGLESFVLVVDDEVLDDRGVLSPQREKRPAGKQGANSGTGLFEKPGVNIALILISTSCTSAITAVDDCAPGVFQVELQGEQLSLLHPLTFIKGQVATMVGKVSERVLLREGMVYCLSDLLINPAIPRDVDADDLFAGLERTDNGMKLTTWPDVSAINQKNYYTYINSFPLPIDTVLIPR